MIRGSAGCLGIDPTKTKLGQIEFFDEDIDRANRIVLADPVFQAFRKQRGLTAIDPLNEGYWVGLYPTTRRLPTSARTMALPSAKFVLILSHCAARWAC